MSATQQDFPFVSLDFPGRTTLKVSEISDRVGICPRQVVHYILDGSLTAINISRAGSKSIRQNCRVPIEEYRSFIIGRLTNDATRSETLRNLPNKALVDLQAELAAVLKEKGFAA